MRLDDGKVEQLSFRQNNESCGQRAGLRATGFHALCVLELRSARKALCACANGTWARPRRSESLPVSLNSDQAKPEMSL